MNSGTVEWGSGCDLDANKGNSVWTMLGVHGFGLIESEVSKVCMLFSGKG